ncbi:MAG: GNVR domain-containing protein [Thermodesulfobacteriota bacterium]
MVTQSEWPDWTPGAPVAPGKDFAYFKAIIRRRRKSFLFTFALLFLVGSLVAFLLPPLFLSKSTILIESQQIPPEYVRTSITSLVEERLHAITQQIMSRTRLTEVIRRFNLYEDMRERFTTEDIVEKMRGDIKFKTISTDVLSKKGGRAAAEAVTVAFSLSYEGRDPSVVQKVANVLASLYLEENLKAREQRASNTTAFLQQEMEQLKAEISQIQNRISQFKEAHLQELPEFTPANVQTIAHLNRNLDQIQSQIHTLRERKILLEGQIVNVDPLSPLVNEEGKTVMNPVERLKYLRLQLVVLKGSLSGKHPDLRKLQKEIQELEAQGYEADGDVEKVKKLEDLKGKQASLDATLNPGHPDALRLSREVEALGRELETEAKNASIKEKSERKPDNPSYIHLKTQISSADLEIGGLNEQARQIREEIARVQGRIDRAPVVEKEYSILMSDYQNARAKFNELTSKFMEAKVAQGMEETQRGERFTIIDPAQLPERPHKPNRIAIAVISLVLALGAGVGMAAVREFADTSVKSSGEFTALSGLPVLAVISRIVSPEERKARRIKWALGLLGAAVLLCATLIIVDQFVMPLDVLWARAERKLMKVTAF